MCYTTEPSPLRQSHSFFHIENASQRVAQQDKNLKSSITAKPCKDCIVEWATPWFSLVLSNGQHLGFPLNFVEWATPCTLRKARYGS